MPSVANTVTINSKVEANLANTNVKNLATERESVRNSSLTQLVADGGISTLVDRATASQKMENYLESINLDRKVRVNNKNAPLPESSSQFQYTYKYGWQTTDQYALLTWCDMNGNPPNCTPTYFIDGCRSYNGTCTKTNGYEQIADTSSGLSYRAYPIKPTRTFNAKYIGVGIGGGLPDFVKIYDSHNGNWNSQYTPSSGEVPNSLLATTTKFDIFFTGARTDADNNKYNRHPGVDKNTPGFQAYLGSSGVDIMANNIYWIVVKYSDAGVRNERCVDFIGPNSFSIPNTFTDDTLLHWGTSLGNGFAYELMSADGVNWEPSNMIQGGVCNTFLAN